MTQRVSIVLPAYRLAPVIRDNVADVLHATHRLTDVEVVVVDDGSDDETAVEAEKAAADDRRVRVARHESNRGKGAALRTGFRESTGEVVVFLDADLDLPPEQVPALVDRIVTGEADLVVGAKRTAMAGGNYPPLRHLLSTVYTTAVRVAFRLPVAETQTGLKAARRSVLEAVFDRVRVERYAFDLELVLRAHRAGFRVVEHPVELRRGASSGPLRLGTLFEMLRDTTRILWWSWFGR